MRWRRAGRFKKPDKPLSLKVFLSVRLRKRDPKNDSWVKVWGKRIGKGVVEERDEEARAIRGPAPPIAQSRVEQPLCPIYIRKPPTDYSPSVSPLSIPPPLALHENDRHASSVLVPVTLTRQLSRHCALADSGVFLDGFCDLVRACSFVSCALSQSIEAWIYFPFERRASLFAVKTRA